jgi:ABC-type uncharacterized transport system ATPase component
MSRVNDFAGGTHLGKDIRDGFIEDTKSTFEPVYPELDTTTGSIYELLFACVDEQAQTRGGIEGSGEHVVNLQKIELLVEVMRARVDNYFGKLDGVVIESNWSLGDTRGYKDHYVFFKINIRQTLRSMWDVNIDSMTLGLADALSDKFVYLHTDHTDRTELILNALEHGKK